MALFIDEVHVRRLLDWGLALEVVEKAFRKIGLEEATNTPRRIMIRAGGLKNADGSAYIEFGDNKILVGVFGQSAHRPSGQCPFDRAAVLGEIAGTVGGHRVPQVRRYVL